MAKKLEEMIKIKLTINSDDNKNNNNNNSDNDIHFELPKSQKLDKLKSLICLMYNYESNTILITHNNISIEENKFKKLTLDNIASLN